MCTMKLILALLILLVCCRGSRLPDGPLIVGYANWGECDSKIVEAAENGVNVIVWFNILLQKNASNPYAPAVTGSGTNNTWIDCVARSSNVLQSRNLTTTHLVSIGGWDQPHPDTSFTAAEWWSTWKTWNQDASRPELGFDGFDGIDWDIEGVNAQNGTDNFFTLALLKLMGDMSLLARADGYSVSLSPCESYMDVTSSYFDLSLKHTYSEWPGFPYHGANIYSYLLAPPYGDNAFDIYMVQLYESWSHANWQIGVVNVPPAAVIEYWARNIIFGWFVNFDTTYVPGIYRKLVDIPSQWVNVNASRLVLGLANGWTGKHEKAPSLAPMNKTKALLIWPSEVEAAFQALQATGKSLRGFMFWDISDEGIEVDRDSPNPDTNGTQALWMAKGLNAFLHVRNNDTR